MSLYRLPFRHFLPALLLLLALPAAFAGIVRGTVTDITGATVRGATIVLTVDGRYIATAISGADGSYQFSTGQRGRFALILTAPSFHQLNSPVFFAGMNDSVERNLVLEPEWVHQSIVVTATGTPTPQPQTNESTEVFGSLDLAHQADLVNVLRQQPGATLVQEGQLGAQTSLFLRGGDSNAGKILLDGVTVGELGGIFDFGSLGTTGIESAEVFRGANSSLYGSDAASGVVSLTTPRGTSTNPVLTFDGDLGNFHTSRAEAQLAGSRHRLDYFGAYSWLQTANALPMDQYHAGSAAGNLGWQPNASLQLRATGHYTVSATGVPSAWNFYGLSDDRKESDQNLYLSGSADYQMTPDFHNRLLYGATRKREQSIQWYPAGICEPVSTCLLSYPLAGNFYGLERTIRGANGAQVTGQALLNYSVGNGSVYPNSLQLVSNRDQLLYQGDYHFTPHVVGLIGFHFEDERGVEREAAYFLNDAADRRNYDYLAELHGDWRNRLFYTLGGSLGHYQILGTQTSPRASLSWYLFRPHKGVWNGTRLSASFADAIREPTLADQSGSLYDFLIANGGADTVLQLHIGQLSAPTARTWAGGIEQGLATDRILLHLNFFHNQFGRQIENVGAGLIPALLPNLSAAQQAQLQAFLNNNGAYSLDINSEAFRALGLEFKGELGLGRNLFLRGGYTYLDTVVQRSFSSDNAALLGGYAPTYNGIPIGIYSPLKGARPFRRPPHSGYLSASWAGKKLVLDGTATFSSRSDDSTYLGYSDLNQGNSLLLPNRNLDFGFARIDLGGSWEWHSHMAFYAQFQNLLSDQHIAPIGYPSLPMTFRAGVRYQIGRSPQ